MCWSCSEKNIYLSNWIPPLGSSTVILVLPRLIQLQNGTQLRVGYVGNCWGKHRNIAYKIKCYIPKLFLCWSSLLNHSLLGVIASLQNQSSPCYNSGWPSSVLMADIGWPSAVGQAFLVPWSFPKVMTKLGTNLWGYELLPFFWMAGGLTHRLI